MDDVTTRVSAHATPVKEAVELGFSNRKRGHAAIVANATTTILYLSILGFVSSTLPPIDCSLELKHTVEASIRELQIGHSKKQIYLIFSLIRKNLMHFVS